MNKITFAGIKGEVIEQSEHGNYLLVKLSNRISIVGTFSNQFHWQEIHESESGFKSFITYIGFNSDRIQQKYLELINEMGGYVRENEEKKSKDESKGKISL